MEKLSAQIATVCECIDQCFAYAFWCDDFARSIDDEDMLAGLDRGAQVVSDATRLQSFLALRKLDEFFGVKSKPDDLVASTLGIDGPSVLGAGGANFLTAAERIDINKAVAHLTERLSLDADSEVDLQAILKRSMPVFSRLAAELRKVDKSKEATHWLDKTDALIKHENEKADPALEAE